MNQSIKEGDLVYVHTLDSEDIEEGVTKGVYEVATLGGNGDIYVSSEQVSMLWCFYELQYIKVVPNKINKLLYKGL